MTGAVAQKTGRSDGGAPPVTAVAAPRVGRPTTGRLP